LWRVPRETVDGLLREGKNIGYNQPCTSLLAVCHGTPISNALNTLPGFNAFATLHDSWGAWLENKGSWNLGTNLGTMPQALLVTYGSLLDQYRYLGVRRSAPLPATPAAPPANDGRVNLPRISRASAL